MNKILIYTPILPPLFSAPFSIPLPLVEITTHLGREKNKKNLLRVSGEGEWKGEKESVGDLTFHADVCALHAALTVARRA